MLRILAILAVLVAGAGAVAPASAMNFKMLKSSTGQLVVLATGLIDKGDARRLGTSLERATRDGNGTKVLLLDSPGGLVGEALNMAQLIESVGVTTVVRKGGVCASACASVLFISGKYRTVETGGALMIHSCYDSRNGRAVSSCNAAISAHAETQGVPGDGLMALQEAAGSNSVVLLDKDDAACFGLTRQPGARRVRNPPCVAAMRK